MSSELLAIAKSHTPAPVACAYFSQEANASEPAPWHKESSGTMLSDALIDGRVGVKGVKGHTRSNKKGIRQKRSILHP